MRKAGRLYKDKWVYREIILNIMESSSLTTVINRIFKIKNDPRRVGNIERDFANGSKYFKLIFSFICNIV